MLLEALLREDATRHRVRLAFPCDGSDLVVSCFILPRPVQPRPSASLHLLGVLVTVELEVLLRRREVESFVQFLSHVPFPWPFCFPAPHQQSSLVANHTAPQISAAGTQVFPPLPRTRLRRKQFCDEADGQAVGGTCVSRLTASRPWTAARIWTLPYRRVRIVYRYDRVSTKRYNLRPIDTSISSSREVHIKETRLHEHFPDEDPAGHGRF